MLDGLSRVSAEVDVSGWRHEKGQASALTGRNVTFVDGHPWGRGPSVDQAIAAAIARPDRFRSLELGVGVREYDSLVYGDGLQARKPLLSDPRAAFQRVFGLGDGASAEDAVTLGQGSVLDFAATQFEALARRASTDDRLRLEAHAALVRDLELRAGGQVAAACDAGLPVPEPTQGDRSFAQDLDAQRDLVVAALACDLTRVASIQFADVPHDLIDAPPTDVHFGYAHHAHADPTAHAMMVRYHRVHAWQFHDLVGALDAVPEGEGTLLDHTLVVWCNELGDGAHGFHDRPLVVAGGSWAWRTGRYLRWAPSTPVRTWQPLGDLDRTGPPHQRFLTSLANAFDLGLASFGETSARSAEGVTVDLRGALDRLVRGGGPGWVRGGCARGPSMLRLAFPLLLVACGTGEADPVFSDARPDRRSEIVAVADDASGTITVFGGNDGPIVDQIPSAAYRADTWVFSPTTGWAEVEGATHPSARGRYAAAHDPTTGRVLLFGGRFRKAGRSGDYKLFADLWAFDPATGTWTELDDGTDGPDPRYHAQLAYDPVAETVYVWGGGTNTDGLVLEPASDLWSWRAGEGWTELTTTGEAPSTRLFVGAAYDGGRNRLVVFGGQKGDFVSQAYHDTYALDLDARTWSRLHDGAGEAPSTRMHAALLHDAARDRYVLFGGHTDLGDANDLWAFDPSDDTWAPLWEGDAFTGEGLGCQGNPSEVPADYVDQDLSGPERRHRGMVAQLGDDLWIFGGMHSECSAYLDDTWRYDLAVGGWTEVIEARSGESCLRRGDDCRCLCL